MQETQRVDKNIIQKEKIQVGQADRIWRNGLLLSWSALFLVYLI